MNYDTKVTRTFQGVTPLNPILTTIDADSIEDAKKQLDKLGWKIEVTNPSNLVMELLIKTDKGWLDIRTGEYSNE